MSLFGLPGSGAGMSYEEWQRWYSQQQQREYPGWLNDGLAERYSQQVEVGYQEYQNWLNGMANYQGPAPGQPNYAAQLHRTEWRRTVSQNWLNAMLDVELGLRRGEEWQT